MEWRLLDTGSNNAFYNMAVDEAVMNAHRIGLVPPTVRFYQWSSPALSLGYFQQAEKEVDAEYCKENNIDIVRRLTGGRAILHDDELTYSIVIGEKTDFLPNNILESYKIISEGIINGLNSLGLAAELKLAKRKKKAPSGFSAACFDAPSLNEVVVAEKKLVGSAQTRQKGVILQHGSIPITINADQLYRTLKMPGQRVRERMKKRFLKKATAVNQESDKKIEITDLKKAIKKGWEKRFGIKLITGELIDEEEEWVEKLSKEKYNCYNWIYKR
ncbi:MAG: biotin/lipoate A/B protein ligase family protein [Thermotogota bacterium]|nr:biotin/lipoate A/B protein ligase family protein [Thermotogota bacterium]